MSTTTTSISIDDADEVRNHFMRAFNLSTFEHDLLSPTDQRLLSQIIKRVEVKLIRRCPVFAMCTESLIDGSNPRHPDFQEATKNG